MTAPRHQTLEWMNLVMRHPEGTHQTYEVCIYTNVESSAATRAYKFIRFFPDQLHGQFESNARSIPRSAL